MQYSILQFNEESGTGENEMIGGRCHSLFCKQTLLSNGISDIHFNKNLYKYLEINIFH